jgi:large subunit ribosomal protein L6
MSRVGEIPVAVPEGVKVDVKGRTVTVEGPKGKLEQSIVPEISVSLDSEGVSFARADNSKRARALHGLCRSLVQNMVTGVSTGFTRTLVINGVGYRAEMKGQFLTLLLGYSNPIDYPIPDGITVTVENNTRITVSGPDKQQLGQVCAEIRSFRPPEPYKGKGVKYDEETIIRKVGKSGVA